MRISRHFSGGGLKRPLRLGTAGVLAAVFAIGSIVPSMALPGSFVPEKTLRSQDSAVTNVNFEHHFWRNHPRNSQRLNRPERNESARGDDGMTALAPAPVDIDRTILWPRYRVN